MIQNPKNQTSPMKRLLSLVIALTPLVLHAQQPMLDGWIRNTNGITGSHYMNGNPSLITDPDSANIKTVLYSSSWVYVRANGVPAYPTGPFLDGNPSITTSQNGIFRFPLAPAQNTGMPTNTTMGNIGMFVNGVALFDCRDGVSWSSATNSLRGGPLGGAGDNVWNRDAIVAERAGFDCSKGHPAMGNYHHHQNPSAFKLDLNVISNICNIYDADGLYSIDSMQHSPLLGFAYDGFPIYGAYAYQGVNGTGPVVRMKSGYHLRNITTRTTSPAGATVLPGPPVSSTYPLGYFREDYEYIAAPGQTDVLDRHNGRFCVTPEYPNGTYAYFCTVDSNWNSYYPYAVGPTFYGLKTASRVTAITEPVTVYIGSSTGINAPDLESMTVFPNPASDLVAIQVSGLNREDISLELFDMTGRRCMESSIRPGQTIAFFDVQTLHEGSYQLRISSGEKTISKSIIVAR
ncbi:MAG: hypothetical protein RL213_1764 [Bacteroidota bacterium]|jgi:hypothetical protein